MLTLLLYADGLEAFAFDVFALSLKASALGKLFKLNQHDIQH